MFSKTKRKFWGSKARLSSPWLLKLPCIYASYLKINNNFSFFFCFSFEAGARSLSLFLGHWLRHINRAFGAEAGYVTSRLWCLPTPRWGSLRPFSVPLWKLHWILLSKSRGSQSYLLIFSFWAWIDLYTQVLLLPHILNRLLDHPVFNHFKFFSCILISCILADKFYLSANYWWLCVICVGKPIITLSSCPKDFQTAAGTAMFLLNLIIIAILLCSRSKK